MIELYGCLLIIYTCVVSAQAAKTHCTVPHVHESESTTLTCHFPEDISLSKKDFTVYHHKDDKATPDPVLSCLWLPDLKCFPKGGYTFDEVVTDKITVEIHSVTKDETGRYTCQTSRSEVEDLSYCELKISKDSLHRHTGKDHRKTTCQFHSSVSETFLTCEFPEDVGQSRADFAVYYINNQGDTDVVVTCVWMFDKRKPDCVSKKGFEIREHLRDIVTFHIPRVTAEKTGKYTCQMAKSKADDAIPCELSAAQGKTSCECYSKESETYLDCHFPQDIGQSRTNFAVYHTKHGIQDVVVSCLWMSDKLRCVSEKGFETETTSGDRVTFRIARVTTDKIGSYFCLMSGSKAEQATACELSPEAEATREAFALKAIIITLATVIFLILIFFLILLQRWYKRHLSRSIEGGTEHSERTRAFFLCRLFWWIRRMTGRGPPPYQDTAHTEHGETTQPLLKLSNEPLDAVRQAHQHTDQTAQSTEATSLVGIQADIQKQGMTGRGPPPYQDTAHTEQGETTQPLLKLSNEPLDAVRQAHQHTDQTAQRTEATSLVGTQADIQEQRPPQPPLAMQTEQRDDESHRPTPAQALFDRSKSSECDRLHMYPPDSHNAKNSEQGGVPAEYQPPSKRKKKKKHKNAGEQSNTDSSLSDAHEFAEGRKDTANSKTEKERKMSLKRLLKLKKRKKGTDKKTVVDDCSLPKTSSLQKERHHSTTAIVPAKKHGAQAIPESQSELSDEYDSDEELNARLEREKTAGTSTTETFKRNWTTKSYSPNSKHFQRNEERATYPQQARRRPLETQKDKKNGKQTNSGPASEPSAEHGKDDATSAGKAGDSVEDNKPKKE